MVCDWAVSGVGWVVEIQVLDVLPHHASLCFSAVKVRLVGGIGHVLLYRSGTKWYNAVLPLSLPRYNSPAVSDCFAVRACLIGKK